MVMHRKPDIHESCLKRSHRQHKDSTPLRLWFTRRSTRAPSAAILDNRCQQSDSAPEV